MNYEIKNPEYVDLEKTKVRFIMVDKSGKESIAELTVPENKQTGVNKVWDRIVEEFDIEEMRQRRNQLETQIQKQQQHRKEQEKASFERQRLKSLFDAKISAFNLPFIKESDIETKAAVRRAPTHETLNFIVNDLIRKFIEENNMSYSDYLDYLDDLEDLNEDE